MAKSSNVYKDKNGWYFKASLGKDKVTGKRRTKTKRGFRTEREAKKAYRELMLEWELKGEVEEETEEEMTFGEFIEKLFLPWYQSQVKENTFNTREYILKRYFDPFEKVKMRNISKLDIQTFQNDLINSGLSNGTINLILSFGSIIWQRAEVFDLVEENVFKLIGKVREKKREIRFWTIDEFTRFENIFFPCVLENKVAKEENLTQGEYVRFFYYTMYRFLFFTGLRLGECLAMTWENVELSEGKIKVRYTVGNILKAQEKQFFSPPKTKGSVRELAVDERTLKILKYWQRYQSKVGDIRLVFSHDDKFLIQSTVRKYLLKITKEHNLPKVSPHDFRHSHASLLIHLGENPKVIQKRLGHSKVEMTLGTYSHLYENSEVQLMEKMNEIIQRKE